MDATNTEELNSNSVPEFKIKCEVSNVKTEPEELDHSMKKEPGCDGDSELNLIKQDIKEETLSLPYEFHCTKTDSELDEKTTFVGDAINTIEDPLIGYHDDNNIPENVSVEDCGHNNISENVSVGDCGHNNISEKVSVGIQVQSRTVPENDIHSRPKPFSCSVCSKSFLHKSGLTRHLVVHAPTKPYLCSVCGKSYTQRSKLNTHMLVHSDKKPYECDQCGKSFIKEDYLYNHMNKHFGYKPFKCNLCGKSFASKSNLYHHTRLHTSYQSTLKKCDVCEKTFSRGTSLKDHMKTHSGIKPFSCNECGTLFTRKCNLTRHMSEYSHE